MRHAEISTRIVCTLFLTTLVSPAIADCPAPIELSKALVKSGYSFAYSQEVPDFFAPEFRKLIEADKACQAKEQGVCRLDWDPWTSAQDGEMGKPVSFSYEYKRDEGAVVAVKYPFVLDKARPATPQVVHLVYRKSADKCWLLDDFIEPAGGSMLRLFSEPAP